MGKLFSLEYGIGGICVLLTLMIFLRVGEFLWRHHQKKEALTDKTLQDLVRTVQENTAEMRLLNSRLVSVETSFSELPKLKLDIRRSFTALKALAGNRWGHIRDELMKDGFTA